MQSGENRSSSLLFLSQASLAAASLTLSILSRYGTGNLNRSSTWRKKLHLHHLLTFMWLQTFSFCWNCLIHEWIIQSSFVNRINWFIKKFRLSGFISKTELVWFMNESFRALLWPESTNSQKRFDSLRWFLSNKISMIHELIIQINFVSGSKKFDSASSFREPNQSYSSKNHLK